MAFAIQHIILFFYMNDIIFRNKNYAKINKLTKSLRKHYNISGGNLAQWFLLEPWHRNCAAAGAGLRSCPATWRCHMTAGGDSQNTTTGSCWQSPSLSLLHAAFDC
jgi:hypothetical protein